MKRRIAALFVCMTLSTSARAEGKPLRAVLLDESAPKAHCGTFEFWTVLRFREQDAGVEWPVAVACTELTRSQYGKTAGNAGVLVKGKTYLLTVSAKKEKGPWGELPAFRAERIDEAR